VSETPPISVLIESPLDAPPLVLPERPKPPPSDETWAKLSPGNGVPHTDPLDEPASTQMAAVWPYILLVMLVSLAGAAVAVHRFAPHVWSRLTHAVGFASTPLPPPLPAQVSFVEPDGAVHPAAIPDAALTAPVGVLVPDASVDVAVATAPSDVLDAPTDAQDAVAQSANARDAGHRRHRHRDDHE
jgi:hypothetical protein